MEAAVGASITSLQLVITCSRQVISCSEQLIGHPEAPRISLNDPEIGVEEGIEATRGGLLANKPTTMGKINRI
jgi:hypothetical protein